MALYKAIRQADGVTTTYHRVLYLQATTNERDSIAVVSYVDAEARERDVRSAGDSRPYRHAKTYEMAYNESMTIPSAYDYLKTLPEFEGAEDV